MNVELDVKRSVSLKAARVKRLFGIRSGNRVTKTSEASVELDVKRSVLKVA